MCPPCYCDRRFRIYNVSKYRSDVSEEYIASIHSAYNTYFHAGILFGLSYVLKMEMCYYQTSVDLQRTTRRYIPGDSMYSFETWLELYEVFKNSSLT
jgi:hypothetical protein